MGLGAMEVRSSTEMGAPGASHSALIRSRAPRQNLRDLLDHRSGKRFSFSKGYIGLEHGKGGSGGNMMDEEQYKTMIVEKYQGDFHHCYRLHQFVQAALQNNKWFTKNHHDAALLYIRPRSFKAYDSVRRLCEVAACEDAAVVLRSLVNLRAVARWISLIDPEKRSKKYLAWYWIERHERATESPAKFSAADIANIQARFDVEKTQFEFINKKGKPAFAKTWYQPEAMTIFDLFQQAGIEDVYERAYRPLSATEHSDVMAYLPMFANAKMVDGETKLEIQSDSNVATYLQAAFQSFADILRTCDMTIPLAEGTELRDIVIAGMEFYKSKSLPKAASSEADLSAARDPRERD